MIDYSKEFVSALNTVLPTHYEMVLTSKTKTPCLSWQEINNYSTVSGDTVGYSRITYQVKVWSDRVADLMRYALEVDEVLRPLGFTRVSSGELYDYNSSMIQKILTYECLARENY